MARRVSALRQISTAGRSGRCVVTGALVGDVNTGGSFLLLSASVQPVLTHEYGTVHPGRACGQGFVGQAPASGLSGSARRRSTALYARSSAWSCRSLIRARTATNPGTPRAVATPTIQSTIWTVAVVDSALPADAARIACRTELNAGTAISPAVTVAAVVQPTVPNRRHSRCA